MMRRIRLVFFCLLLSVYGNAQNTHDQLDSVVTRFVDKLHRDDIDTICVYQNYFLGGYVRVVKGVCSFDPAYILWKKKGKTWLTKVDICYQYETVNVKADSVWNTFIENKDSIKEEVVLPFQLKGGARQISDHEMTQKFKIAVGDETLTCSFWGGDMREKNYQGELNINYKHNMDLKGKKIIDLLDRLIEKNKEKLKKVSDSPFDK
jgi:hypothetical protein